MDKDLFNKKKSSEVFTIFQNSYKTNIKFLIRLAEERSVSLWYNGECVAVIRDPEIYEMRKEERCARQWGLVHKEHPYQQVRHEGLRWEFVGFALLWCFSFSTLVYNV